MPRTPVEPRNIVLEQFRLMRAEMSAGFAKVDTEIAGVKAEIADLKKELRGFRLNTVAEVYKANLTVANFADHERRISALEAVNASRQP